MQSHRKSVKFTQSDIRMDAPKHKIFLVPEKSNMIDFAKKNIDNYDPDSGKGYYQFTETSKEYISPKTEVVLVSEVSIQSIPTIYTSLDHTQNLYRMRSKYVLVLTHVKSWESVIKESF